MPPPLIENHQTIPSPPSKPPRVTSRTARLLTANVRQSLVKAGFVAVLLAVGGLLIWLLTSLLATATLQSANQPGTPQETASPAAPSATPRPSLPVKGVSPLDFRVGDCFKDFDPEAIESTVVACGTDHSAQLVAAHRYEAADSYPGGEAMKAKAREACQSAALTDKSNAYDLTYRLAYPSTASWGQGDRRVDCYVTSAAGNIIKSSLLP